MLPERSITNKTSVGARGRLNLGTRVNIAGFVAVGGGVSTIHRGSSISLAETRMTTSLSHAGVKFESITDAEVALEMVMAIGWDGEEIDVIRRCVQS